jgi:hypothetical protein
MKGILNLFFCHLHVANRVVDKIANIAHKLQNYTRVFNCWTSIAL